MKLLALLALLLTLDACQNPSRVLAALHQDQFVISLKMARALGLNFSAAPARARRRGDRIKCDLLRCICRLMAFLPC